jgi:hypothetical protein
MTASIQISRQLEEWASLAGYSLTPGSSTSDGRAMLWSAGGEVRYFIGSNDGDWFIITDSDRLGSENFKLAAVSMSTVEKYLFGMFGEYIRSKRSLPPVNVPIAKDEISAEFTIQKSVFESANRLALIHSDGSPLAFSSADPVYGTMELAGLSLYLTATVDDITAAFLNPDGRPLFTLQ